MKKGNIGAMMFMVFASVLAMTVMMLSSGSAEGATITAKAGTGGKITPYGSITVRDGTTQQFSMAAASGYTVLSVTGCNGTLSGSTYTTGRISANCTVLASFKLIAPKISSFKINNDAVETPVQSVTLNYTTAPGSMPTHYRASEFPDFLNAVWQTGIAAPIFELRAGAGVKTVYLQLRDSSTNGISNVMSDTINLKTRQVYNVKGNDFYALAMLRGFNSSAQETNDDVIACNCSIVEGPADYVMASQVAARVWAQSNLERCSCAFEFFDFPDNATLKNGFVILGVSGSEYPEFEGCNFSVNLSVSPDRTWMNYEINGEADVNHNCRYVIDRVILEGPADTDWRAALGP